MNKIYPFFALWLFSGCMVGPDYRPPCYDIPDAYLHKISDAKDTINLDWWTQFDDPVLETLILNALTNNKDVQIAAANIVNALGILIQTRSQLFPQIGYEGFYSRNRMSQTLPFNPPNPLTTLELIANASWEIDLWGRIRRLTESASANVYASYEARQETILTLVASVANAYIQLRGLDEQLEISIRTRDAYGEEVKYFESQFKYGQTSLMSVAQARTQYEAAVAKIPQIKSAIVETENAICILLGQNPAPIPRGKSIVDLKLPAVPEGLPSEILVQRPDIRQAEWQLIGANAQIGAAQALYFPSISLTGFYGGASMQLNQLFNGPSNTWNFTGSAVGPIFTAGAISGQVIQAKAQHEVALINYQRVIQNAFAEVEDALNRHTNLIDQVDATRRLVDAAGEYQRLAILQYKEGYSPYFVVIQAQEQYFPAELSWAQARAELFISLVNIYRALGGGWVTLADQMTLD